MHRVRNALYWLSNPPTVWKWLLAATDIGALAGILAWSWEVFALVFTAILIAWYSLEMHRLNQISLYPGLTIRWFWSSAGWILILSNQGKGTALNISVDQVVRADYGYTFNLSGVNAIYPGDTVEIKMQRTDLRKGTIAPPNNEEIQMLGDEPLVTRVHFSPAGSLRTRHFTEVEIKNPPTVRILSTNWY